MVACRMTLRHMDAISSIAATQKVAKTLVGLISDRADELQLVPILLTSLLFRSMSGGKGGCMAPPAEVHHSAWSEPAFAIDHALQMPMVSSLRCTHQRRG